MLAARVSELRSLVAGGDSRVPQGAAASRPASGRFSEPGSRLQSGGQPRTVPRGQPHGPRGPAPQSGVLRQGPGAVLQGPRPCHTRGGPPAARSRSLCLPQTEALRCSAMFSFGPGRLNLLGCCGWKTPHLPPAEGERGGSPSPRTRGGRGGGGPWRPHRGDCAPATPPRVTLPGPPAQHLRPYAVSPGRSFSSSACSVSSSMTHPRARLCADNTSSSPSPLPSGQKRMRPAAHWSPSF